MMPLVSVAQTPNGYPANPPFDPAEDYPEAPFAARASSPNGAYAAVRRSFELLGLDRENFGTPRWNPLRRIIRPGATVIVKPNWVYHAQPSEPHPEEILVTHPSVIRAVLDYVLIACGREGRIVLADAPVQSANFEEILRISNIARIRERFAERGIDIEVMDLRAFVSDYSSSGRVLQRPSSRPDPAGYRVVDLGARSHLEDVADRASRFRCLDYDPRALHENHSNGHHRYLIAGSVLDADAVINVPKLKTHGKSGITASLKNLVGINGDKAYLPHFRIGSPRFGGDDYPFPSALKWARNAAREQLMRGDSELLWRVVRWVGLNALAVARQVRKPVSVGGRDAYAITSGHWHGNDTTWRMVLDLNLALAFARRDGSLASDPQRAYFSVVDGIIAGERNGPFRPERRDLGVVFATHNPVAGDWAAAWMMGFDPERIPLLRAARARLGFGFMGSPSEELRIATDAGEVAIDAVTTNWRLRAPDGWSGFIERDSSVRAGAA